MNNRFMYKKLVKKMTLSIKDFIICVLCCVVTEKMLCKVYVSKKWGCSYSHYSHSRFFLNAL